MKKNLFICFLLWLATDLLAQSVIYTKEDSLFCMHTLDRLNENPKDGGEKIIQIAKSFLGRPYVAGTLEKEPEQLIVNFSELDCTTFVESVLALSQRNTSFEDYTQNLRLLRYRRGIVLYTERLHYIADWIYENQKRGILKDVTSEMPGSKPLTLSLSFMSTHPNAYSALKGHSERISTIRDVETAINKRNIYSYLPKENMKQAASSIKNGDIIVFVTSIKGLDVTHMGIAYWRKNGDLTFIHASSLAKKVIINQCSLQEYLKTQKSCKGLWILRTF